MSTQNIVAVVFLFSLAFGLYVAIDRPGQPPVTIEHVSRNTDDTADSYDKQLPEIVVELIAKSEAGDPAWSVGKIWKFEYQRNAVYFVPERCCHLPSELYDETGALICHPSGDFVGHVVGDGKCEDFLLVRENGSLIWADKRVFRFIDDAAVSD